MNDQMEMRKPGSACRFAPAREFRDGHDSAGAKRQAPSCLWVWSWCAILLLGAFLLFAHGCHGDEDTELFTSAYLSEPPVTKY
jgi:hypothetical protein